jgi:mRNA interferase RelE/StbE
VTQRRVVFAESVSLSLSKYLDDRARLRAVLDAIDALADDPRPPGSVPWGPVLSRLHIGPYRVMYTIGEDVVTVERVDRVTSR